MKLSTLIKTSLFAYGLQMVLPTWASTTYTYTDTTDSTFSGSFSVTNALADGSYSFLSPANQPTGFIENFFATPFVDGRGLSRTPSLSLLDITINNGAVTVWDIRATSLFTSVTYSTCGRAVCKVYHDGATLIFHDTNVPYLPGNGIAYQSVIAAGDYKTYYTAGFAYQEAMTGGHGNPGVWSVASSALPVPEPQTYALLLAGLATVGCIARRRRSGKA